MLIPDILHSKIQGTSDWELKKYDKLDNNKEMEERKKNSKRAWNDLFLIFAEQYKIHG